ncbi:thioredoxin family protein [Pedobacter cryoconitis]|uniref:Thioredoxin-related protein n=1 Tax=Pedobacter cryoconitis TaxID=188932 RepID=A0A7X0J6D1_9SPHI|nr:thioredoxin family protein [Pedobacter cryoconitis]MBB6501187.1 thioredoxin-related protein [Pedobacter cryoconitis]
MKILLITLLSFLTIPIVWSGDFNEAVKEAKTAHKTILINFSGSDWCGPCIRLRKEILESDAFTKYAADHLVLVRADFPRQKKNQLIKEQIKRNESLADKYNPDGKFPYTLLVNENGQVLKSWEGYPADETPDQFVQEINNINQTR